MDSKREKIVLSYLTVEPLVRAANRDQTTVEMSLDLGLTQSKVTIDEKGATFPDGQSLDWANVREIFNRKSRCFVVEYNRAVPVAVFSAFTHWSRALYPTYRAPVAYVSGIPMHQLQNLDPVEMAVRKVRALGIDPDSVVLDTAMGLGYTAIEAGRLAERVVTIEVDPVAAGFAQLNPWSRELFDNPKIERVTGSDPVEISRFKDNEFTHILHDPPTLKFARDLYAPHLYKEFYRVLPPGGKFFHYLCDPASKRCMMIFNGVSKKLLEIGFKKVEPIYDAFGLLAVK